MNTYLSLESTSVAVFTWFLSYSCIQCTRVYEWYR